MISPEFQPIRVQRLAKTVLPTRFGEFSVIAYSSDDGSEHVAYIPKGKLRIATGDPIRFHTECLASDAFGSSLCDCGTRLHESMEYISKRGLGAVIYVRDVVGRGVLSDIPTLCREANVRDIQIAASIANDLTNQL